MISVDSKVIEFPRRQRSAKGRDAAFEMLADMLIECVGDVARLKARVDELEAERRSPGRAVMVTGVVEEMG